MVKVMVVVILLAVAQIFPSCGGGPSGSAPSGEPAAGGQPQVIGWIDEKRTRVWETLPWFIVINQLEYGVPYEFWTTVDVGDLVKFDGQKWSIVRKARR